MPDVLSSSSLAERVQPSRSSLPWWVIAVVIGCVLLLAAGAYIAMVRPAMLLGSGEHATEAVHVYAGYFVSRSLAIAAMLLLALLTRATRMLRVLLVLTALIQFLDAGIDGMEQRWAVLPGVVVIGALVLAAANRVGPPLWTVASWREMRPNPERT